MFIICSTSQSHGLLSTEKLKLGTIGQTTIQNAFIMYIRRCLQFRNACFQLKYTFSQATARYVIDHNNENIPDNHNFLKLRVLLMTELRS